MRTTERNQLRFFRKRNSTEPIQQLINDLLERMQVMPVTSDDYSMMLEKVERLHKLKANQGREPISGDTIAIVIGNLAGILFIIAYEQRHVMTSKGFSQILRPRTPQQQP